MQINTPIITDSFTSVNDIPEGMIFSGILRFSQDALSYTASAGTRETGFYLKLKKHIVNIKTYELLGAGSAHVSSTIYRVVGVMKYIPYPNSTLVIRE